MKKIVLVIFIFAIMVPVTFGQQMVQEQRLTGRTNNFEFTPINNGTAYSVSKGTATTGEVIIPAYYRPNANRDYLPVTEIGRQAFRGCANLTSITIPAVVTSIGVEAFVACHNLTNITVVADNPMFASEGGILYNKTKTILRQAPGAISGTVIIPADVTTIDSMAFAGCWSLTTITIQAGVTTIGDRAFFACEGLTNIAIPSGVISIGREAFKACFSLTAITIPASITSIGDSAFDFCENLISITIPTNVRSVGYGAFWSWSSSQTINILGHASEATADAAWNRVWRFGCNATINYLGR